VKEVLMMKMMMKIRAGRNEYQTKRSQKEGGIGVDPSLESKS